MKGCTYRSWMILAALFSVIFSCARQAAPTGGKKDITPPKIIRSLPPYGSLNFKGKKVVITFDEFIGLDKMNEKFMISPPLKKKPTILLKGKNLNIEFLENLKDSTTYTMYFQDAIRDLNEGNPIPNYQFVFSTGNVLDSLSVTGNVYNAFDLDVPDKALILMHRQLADSAPVKLLPEYITLVDKNGGFRLNNIRGGTYHLFALQDNNNDKKYDPAEESFAFMDNAVKIDPIKNYIKPVIVIDTAKIKPDLKKSKEAPVISGEYKLFMYTAAKKNHFLSSSGRKPGYHLNYTLSLPPDTGRFEFDIPGTPPQDYFLERNSTGDTIDVWLTDSLLYTRELIKTLIGYPYTDSTGKTKIKMDSIPMRFTFPRITKGKEARKKLSFATNVSFGTIKPGQNIVVSAETPLRRPFTPKIHLYETEKTARKEIPYTIGKDSMNSRRYYLNTKLKEGASYLLITEAGSFSNIYGDMADSTGFKFTVRTQDSYSILALDLSNITGNTIIQLLDDKEKIISEKRINQSGKIEFPFLEKGTYRIRAIYDLNGDGKWTTGDYKTKRQPEPVSYYPEKFEFKQANFNIDQSWDLSIWNQKDQKLRSTREPGK